MLFAIILATYVDTKQRLDLLLAKVKRGLVVRAAGVGNDTVDGARLSDDLVDGSGDALLVGDVRLERRDAAGELLGGGGELLAGLRVVDRVHLLSAVEQAALGDSKADSAVTSGDFGSCQRRLLVEIERDSGDLPAMILPLSVRTGWTWTASVATGAVDLSASEDIVIFYKL